MTTHWTRIVFCQPWANAPGMERVHARQRESLVSTNTLKANGTVLLRRFARGTNTRLCAHGRRDRQSVRLEGAHRGLQHVSGHGTFDDLHVARPVVNDHFDAPTARTHKRRHHRDDRIRRGIQNSVLPQQTVQLQYILAGVNLERTL